ncbi:class I SAM-dependent methyltransferase [Cystobacter fuscus]
MKRLLLAVAVPVLLPVSLVGCASTSSAAKSPEAEATVPMVSNGMGSALNEVLAGSWRDQKNTARDPYRHPKETLSFFGVTPNQTVVEITPGGGWYSEILAPYLREGGHYVAAVYDEAIPDQPKYRAEQNAKLRALFSGNTAVYGSPEVRAFDPAKPAFGPNGSADTVLTFRNAHNWVDAGALPRTSRRSSPCSSRAACSAWSITARSRAPTSRSRRSRATSPRRWSSNSPRTPASSSRARARSTPTRRTPPITPTACGRCPPPTVTTPQRTRSTRPPVRATA